jgi:hypothetical protein
MATIQETTLINKDTLMKFTQVNSAMDSNLVSAAIYIAQDMYLEQYLGTALIQKLKDDVNSWAGIYDTLMSEHIPKVLAWWTLYELYPMMWIKHDNGGLYRRTTDDTETISATDLGNLRSEAKSRAESYTQRLINYLCANAVSIPEYNDNTWPNKAPKLNAFNNSIMFTNSKSATSDNGRPLYDPQLIDRRNG